jgi:hypothetical protein
MATFNILSCACVERSCADCAFQRCIQRHVVFWQLSLLERVSPNKIRLRSSTHARMSIVAKKRSAGLGNSTRDATLPHQQHDGEDPCWTIMFADTVGFIYAEHDG